MWQMLRLRIWKDIKEKGDRSGWERHGWTVKKEKGEGGGEDKSEVGKGRGRRGRRCLGRQQGRRVRRGNSGERREERAGLGNA